MISFRVPSLFDTLRRTLGTAKTSPAHPQAQHTLIDTLIDILSQRGMAPEAIDLMGAPGVQVLAVDGSAVVISNPYGDALDIPLAQYQGVSAYHYPLHYNPAHPPSDYQADPDRLIEVYETKQPVGDVEAALEDLGRLLIAVAYEVVRPLPGASVDDLLITALEREGFKAKLDSLGGGAEGVVVGLDDGTHMLITDPGGTQINYPVAWHTGLLVNRYPNDDVSVWRVVYESNRTDAVQDVQAAVLAIAAEARRPLTEMVATTSRPESIDILSDQFEQLSDQPVGAVLLSLLRSQGWECAQRALGSGGEGVYIPMDDGTHMLITDPIECGLSATVCDHKGVLVTRVSQDTQRHHEVYDSHDTGIEIHDTFSALADLMQAIAAIGSNDLDPFRF